MMDTQSSIPETRVYIDQHVLFDSNGNQQSPSDSLKIDVDHLDSLKRSIPDVHLSSKLASPTTLQILSDTPTNDASTTGKNYYGGGASLKPSDFSFLSEIPVFETFKESIQDPNDRSIYSGNLHWPSVQEPSEYVTSSPVRDRKNVSPASSLENHSSPEKTRLKQSDSLTSFMSLSEAHYLATRIDTQPYFAPLQLSVHEPAELCQPDALRNDASSPDLLTCDSGFDDSSLSEEERLKMHSAFLEGRLSVYGREAEVWLRERAEIATEVASLRKRLEAAHLNLKEMKEVTNREINEMQLNASRLQDEARQSRSKYEEKAQETKQLHSALSSISNETADLKAQLSDIKQKSVAKDQAIASLKAKLSELYADLESFRCSHAQALDKNTDLSAELSSLKRSQEWYREQLQMTQTARDRLQNELVSARRWLDYGGNSAQTLALENAQLETKVLSSEAALADAKRNLSHQLEAIRSDILERESMFEKIAAERNSLEALCNFKASQVSECQHRITVLQSELSEAEHETTSNRALLDNLKHMLMTVETERNSLKSCVSNLESQLAQHKITMDEQQSAFSLLSDKLARLEGNNNKLDASLTKALEEKAALEASLQNAQQDRSELNACLNTLKSSMSALDVKFAGLQSELETRNAELSSVLSSRDELAADLEVIQATLCEKTENLKEISSEKEQLNNTISLFQAENQGLRDDLYKYSSALEAAQNSIGPECEAASTRAREPLLAQLSDSNNTINALKLEITNLQTKVNNLLLDQERHCSLIEAHQDLQKKYDSLLTTHNTTMENARITEKSLSEKLIQSESLYMQTLTAKSLEIETLTNKLNNKTNELLDLSLQMANAKRNHDQELAQNSAEFSNRICDLEARFASTKAESLSLEQKLDETLKRERAVVANHQQELKAYKEAVASLESQTAVVRTLEGTRSELLFQLEAAKGREIGLSDTINSIKRHSAALEVALSKRQAELVELAEKAERQTTMLDQTRNQLYEVSQSRSEIDSTIIPVVNSINLNSVPRDLTESLTPKPCVDCLRLSTDASVNGKTIDKLHLDLANALASLDITKQEILAKSAQLANETMAKGEAINSRLVLTDELNKVKKELNSALNQLSEAQFQLQRSSADVALLSSKSESNALSNSHEVQALQDLIKTLTSHIEALKQELAEANNSTWYAQSALAHIRGSIRGILERRKMLQGLEGGNSFPSSSSNWLSGTDAQELETLIADDACLPLMHSKPLMRVNNYLDSLQKEINTLEEQVVSHASVVRDSVEKWRSIEEEAFRVRTEKSPLPS